MISITADRSDKKKRKIKIWAVAFWLLVWQGVSQVLGQEILLVSPVSVLRRLLELAVTADFWSSIAFSIIRIMGGFLLAALLGILLGALAAGVSPVRQLLEPAVLTIKSIPVASFVILVTGNFWRWQKCSGSPFPDGSGIFTLPRYFPFSEQDAA